VRDLPSEHDQFNMYWARFTMVRRGLREMWLTNWTATCQPNTERPVCNGPWR